MHARLEDERPLDTPELLSILQQRLAEHPVLDRIGANPAREELVQTFDILLARAPLRFRARQKRFQPSPVHDPAGLKRLYIRFEPRQAPDGTGR